MQEILFFFHHTSQLFDLLYISSRAPRLPRYHRSVFAYKMFDPSPADAYGSQLTEKKSLRRLSNWGHRHDYREQLPLAEDVGARDMY